MAVTIDEMHVQVQDAPKACERSGAGRRKEEGRELARGDRNAS